LTTATAPLDLIDICRRAAELWDTKVAATFDLDGMRLTFADIERSTNQYARALASFGVKPGDVVAAMLPNRSEFALVWLGLVKLGAIMVPLNTRYRELDARHVLHQSGAVGVVATDEFRPLLSKLAARVIPVSDLASLAAA
jgi:crotonobetaine/carnitine-CoA ligase